MTDDSPNEPCILYRRIGDSWYVLQGHMSDEYCDAYYKRDGVECANQGDAIQRAHEMAKQAGIEESFVCSDPN